MEINNIVLYTCIYCCYFISQRQLEEDIEKMGSGNKQGYKTAGKCFASVNIPYFKDKKGDVS